MAYQFSEIEPNTRIVLHAYSGDKHVDLNAVVLSHLSSKLTEIAIDYPPEKRLVFDTVQVDVVVTKDNEIPLIWKDAKVINHSSGYVLQVTTSGIKKNRRNSFRISIAEYGTLVTIGQQPKQVLIKDLSISGFAITDNHKELDLSVGNRVSVSFEDLEYYLNLEGQVVRRQEFENYTIYGFKIINLCKDLSSYIYTKQRKKGS